MQTTHDENKNYSKSVLFSGIYLQNLKHCSLFWKTDYMCKKITLFSFWTNLYTNTAYCAAANVLVGFLHVVAAFLWAENIHSVQSDVPFSAGNCLCRAGVGADCAVTAGGFRDLRLLRKWAVGKE